MHGILISREVGHQDDVSRALHSGYSSHQTCGPRFPVLLFLTFPHDFQAWRLWQQGRGLELVDSSITEAVHEGEAIRFITVGLLCTQENPAHRPSMSSVISMLGNEQAALPLPTYPPFFEDRGAKVTIGTLFSSQSVNEVTNTDVYGR